MRLLQLLLLSAAACAAAAAAEHGANAAPARFSAPPRPVFPTSFTLRYNFSLPYTLEFQSDELVYDVVMYRDADRRLAKQELYSGSNVILATGENYFESTPRVDELGCAAYVADDESEQLLSAPLLPDLNAKKKKNTTANGAGAGDEGGEDDFVWQYKGQEKIEGVASAGGDGRVVLADCWEARQSHAAGAKETVYRFWTSASAGAGAGDGAGAVPLRLHQSGPDLLSGSHFDEYVVDYSGLVPGPPEAARFEKPESCVGVEVEVENKENEKRRGARLAATAASLLAAGLPCSDGRKGLLSPSAPLSPSYSAFEENAAFVEEHNRKRASASASATTTTTTTTLLPSSSSPSPPPPSYSVALNRFASLSDSQFSSTYLMKKDDKKVENKEKKKKKISAELPYRRIAPVGRIPSAVDWRATGAVLSAVKDQSTCGSCWAFGTAAAVEGASFLASKPSTKMSVAASSTLSSPAFSVSEQQFMDCSWDYGSNSACGGGDADAALDWLVRERRGRAELEEDYQYRGAAGFCKTKTKALSSRASSNSSSSSSSRALPRVKGYAYVPKGDDEALMEAVYSRGPLQVSIDAAAKGFRFYASGVYDEPSCSPKEEDLDHSVALVGYGTDEASGKDYWLVRNSWSTYWGDAGYIKIARSNGGCGVGTAAMYVVMEEDEEGDEVEDEET